MFSHPFCHLLIRGIRHDSPPHAERQLRTRHSSFRLPTYITSHLSTFYAQLGQTWKAKSISLADDSLAAAIILLARVRTTREDLKPKMAELLSGHFEMLALWV